MPAARATAKDAGAAGAEKTAARSADVGVDDAGAAEMQARMDEATSKGFFGVVPDPHPNSAYSLESGPESPSAAAHTPSATAAASKKEG